jgi:TonB family protein
LAVAAIFGFCAVIPQASLGARHKISEFYVVSVGFSDALPGWHHSILEVKPDGHDMVVRYIRVDPGTANCGAAAVIRATATRLPNTSLHDVTHGVNLCAMDQPFLNRTFEAFPQTQRMGVFADDRFTIVAKCGTDSRVIRLPYYWKVDMARLKRERPDIALLWTLEKAVGTRAFGPFPSIDVVPREMAARFPPAGEAILSELKSGKFDSGLAPLSFKEDVAALRTKWDVAEFSVKLANADRVRFERYVNPQYPPLAKQARISGTVELEITSNPTSGETEQVTAVSGHPLLVPAAKEAAQQWRFPPGADTALHATRVTLEFVFNCP